jgi:glycosyltransferase involved in cell wall biosynthesis
MATTVVIPVWDAYVQFLAEAVESVLSDAPETPVMVVDNASTVPVPELPGTHVIRTDQRLTVGAARTLGLEAVRTEHVLVLDADDALLPGTLGFLESRLEAAPDLAAACVSILDGATGERHRTPRRFAMRLARHPRLFAFLHSVWSLYPIQGCAIMRTTDALAAGGYPDTDWGDDWVLSVSFAYRGKVELSEHLGRYYRPTPGSIWRRPRTACDLAASARLVRDRIRTDPGVARWVAALLPLIALLQLTAVYVARPLYLFLRGSRAGPPPGDERGGGTGD